MKHRYLGTPFEAVYMVRSGTVKQMQAGELNHQPVVDIYWPSGQSMFKEALLGDAPLTNGNP